MVITDEQLYSLLLDNQYLTEQQLLLAKDMAKQRNVSLYDGLIEKDLISDENLGKLIADFLRMPFVSLAKSAINDSIYKSIPQVVARSHMTVAYIKTADSIRIATSDPKQQQFFSFLSKKLASPVTVFYATPKDISDTFRLYKKQLQSSFDDLIKEQIKLSKGGITDAPVAKIVDLLIEYAYENKASDIHIEPHQDNSHTRFRIDGVMHEVLEVPKPLHQQIITRIKVLSKLRTDEHLSAQDGKLQIKLPEEELDIRVSIVPIVEGENIVMRLLSSRTRQFSLSDLGMSEQDLVKVRSAYQKPYGMVLVTGPTGSGKTTSIYAILKILNTKEKNIDTIEDPVEYEIEGINQIQVNTQTNLTFANGLRSILRQDPDIVFVGEIRDKETANIGINAALTGHLVLSTLHTNDAATAVPRFIDMDIEPFLVSSTLNIIIAQRLVRKICDTCRVSYTQTYAELAKNFNETIMKKHFTPAKEIRMYRGKGCAVCHQTGYIGRIGVFEVLAVTNEIQELINQKVDASDLKKTAVKLGMTTMLEDGLDKVQRGVTTVEEVLRVTRE